MYRLAVCDNDRLLADHNEALVREILGKNHLKEGMDYQIDIFTQPQGLVENLQRDRGYYQLVLMDIELDDANGLEVAKEILQSEAACRLIYITAFRDYVFDSFDTHPLQYLLKPVDKEKLAAALLYDYQNNYKPSQLLIRNGEKSMPLRVKDILYIESTQHKSAIYLIDGRVEFWNRPLTSLQKELPPQTFCRCHNSYLINLSQVTLIVRYEATLKDGSAIPVSKKNYGKTLDKYIQYIKG